MRENSEIIIPRKFPNIRYITGDVYHVYNQYCTTLVLGGIPKIPNTGVSKSIPLHFCKYRNTMIGIIC